MPVSNKILKELFFLVTPLLLFGYGNKIEINISGEAAIDFSGVSVSLNNDESILASVAFFNNGNGADSVCVRVFEWTGSNWVQPVANIMVKVEVFITTCKK